MGEGDSTVRLVRQSEILEERGGSAESEGSGYRRLGIEKVQSFAREALSNLEELDQWATQVSAVPTHLIPLVKDLMHKCRRVEDELRQIR